MSLARTVFKIVTASLGLVAVFLAALEHEDLIWQEGMIVRAFASEVSEPAEAAPASGMMTSGTLARISTLSADTGTEGTFRSELHQFSHPSEAAVRLWSRVWVSMLRQPVWCFVPVSPCLRGIALVGVTELRL